MWIYLISFRFLSSFIKSLVNSSASSSCIEVCTICKIFILKNILRIIWKIYQLYLSFHTYFFIGSNTKESCLYHIGDMTNTKFISLALCVNLFMYESLRGSYIYPFLESSAIKFFPLVFIGSISLFKGIKPLIPGSVDICNK